MLTSEEQAALARFFEDNSHLLGHSPLKLKAEWWGTLRRLGLLERGTGRWRFSVEGIEISAPVSPRCENVRVIVVGEDYRGRTEEWDVSETEGPWWAVIRAWLGRAAAIHDLRVRSDRELQAGLDGQQAGDG